MRHLIIAFSSRQLDRDRIQPSRVRTLVADVVDEPCDLFQLGTQHLGVVEIRVPLFGLRMDFEDHGKHRHLPYLLFATTAMQSILISKWPGQAGTLTKMRAGGS